MQWVQGRALVGGQAEAFLSQSMPKTQSPGTLSLNHVYFLYSNNNYLIFQRLINDLKKKKVGSDYKLYVHIMIMSDVLKSSLQITTRVKTLTLGLM